MKTTTDMASAPQTGCCAVQREDSQPARPDFSQPSTAAGNPPSQERDAVRLPGGQSSVGTDAPALPIDGESPKRQVKLRPFLIDRHAVSGARFRAFVDATGYVSEAERYGWSFVCHMLLDDPGR